MFIFFVCLGRKLKCILVLFTAMRIYTIKEFFAGRELKGALQPFLIQRHNSRPLAFEEFQITNSTTDHDFPHKNMLVQRKRAQ